MCTARLCGLKQKSWRPLCHKDQEQPKAWDGKLSCLEGSAAALCHLGSRGDDFLKMAMSFPLCQSMWGTCGEHWRAQTWVREMHCWKQVHIIPFQGMGLFRWVQRMSPHPLCCCWRREREASPTLANKLIYWIPASPVGIRKELFA